VNVLNGPLLHDCARGAGFRGGALVTAIAVAYGASGGVPSYDHATGPGNSTHYRGLWGLDVGEYPLYALCELENPHVAASIAHELCELHGGWRWNAAWRANAHVPYLETAATAATMFPGPGYVAPTIDVRPAAERHGALYTHFHTAQRALAHTIRRKVT